MQAKQFNNMVCIKGKVHLPFLFKFIAKWPQNGVKVALLQYFDFPSDDNVATSISSATTNYPLSLSKSIDLMTELQVK